MYAKTSIVALLLLLSFFSARAQEYEVYQTLTGHTGSAYNVRFSPDGKILASTGADGNVMLWDVQSGALLRTLSGITGNANEATFSHNGKFVASCGADGIAKVWETETGKTVGTYVSRSGRESFDLLRQQVSFVCFSRDDKKVYFGGDAGFIMEADISAPGGSSVLFASTNNSDGSWYSSITGGCLSHDGKSLLVSVGDLVMVFDLASRKLSKTYKYENKEIPGLNDVVIFPDGKTIAAWAFDGNIILWDSKTGKQTLKMKVGDEKQHSTIAFNADGSKIATAAFRNIARVWDMKTQKQLQELRAHSRIIRSIRYSPTEDIIATAGYDATVRLWKSKKPDVYDLPNIAETTEKPPVKEEKPPFREERPLKEERPVREEKPVKEGKPSTTVTASSAGSSFSEKDLIEGATINLKNIQFEQSTANFLETSYADLQKLLEVMLENSKMRVQLLGHTDNQGSKVENYRLSINRVEAVKNFLIQNGIAAERIATKGWGPDKPIADNTKEETRRLNRRVEVMIVSLK